MIKSILFLLASALVAVFFTACNEPKPEPKAVNTTSYKSNQASWQQFKSEKAMDGLDKEMNK